MPEINTFFETIGGVALILYGIHLSGVNLQKIFGSYLEEVLKKAGDNPIKGLLVGTGVTGAIHSNTTVTMMLIGLISGGFMTLVQTVPVLLGANIGSTVAVQLASFRIGGFALLFLTIGVIIHISKERKTDKRIGEAIIGFGLLFLGAEFLFSATGNLVNNEIALRFVNSLTNSPEKAILAGALATLVIQSLSAAAILTVALGTASLINLPTALFLILGANLGSSLKITYLTLQGKNFSGKLALIHLIFNFLGVIIFLFFFDSFYDLAKITSENQGRQIANAHMLYNIIAAFVFIPFAPAIAKAVEKISPGRTIKKSELFYLDKKLVCTPSVSLQQVNRGVVEMAKTTYEMLEMSREIFFENKPSLASKIEKLEAKIDSMTEKISEYTIHISQQTLNKKDAMKLYSLMRIIADIEHISDHILAISKIFAKIKKDNISFSQKAQDELLAIYGKIRIMQNLVIKSLEEDNVRLASEISSHENKVDEIIKKISSNQEKRTKAKECSQEADKYFSDILHNFERIGDHYDNMAYAVIDRFRRKERK